MWIVFLLLLLHCLSPSMRKISSLWSLWSSGWIAGLANKADQIDQIHEIDQFRLSVIAGLLQQPRQSHDHLEGSFRRMVVARCAQ
jgi:hypothetical protein